MGQAGTHPLFPLDQAEQPGGGIKQIQVSLHFKAQYVVIAEVPNFVSDVIRALVEGDGRHMQGCSRVRSVQCGDRRFCAWGLEQVCIAPDSSCVCAGAGSLTEYALFKGSLEKVAGRLHLFRRQRSYLIVYSQYA